MEAIIAGSVFILFGLCVYIWSNTKAGIKFLDGATE